LAGQVTQWLQQLWSPQEISHRLRIEFADDPMMHVSHETIYQSLFVQGRGELRRNWPAVYAPGASSDARAGTWRTRANCWTW
jgi:IS30 family transposase